MKVLLKAKASLGARLRMWLSVWLRGDWLKRSRKRPCKCAALRSVGQEPVRSLHIVCLALQRQWLQSTKHGTRNKNGRVVRQACAIRQMPLLQSKPWGNAANEHVLCCIHCVVPPCQDGQPWLRCASRLWPFAALSDTCKDFEQAARRASFAGKGFSLPLRIHALVLARGSIVLQLNGKQEGRMRKAKQATCLTRRRCTHRQKAQPALPPQR